MVKNLRDQIMSPNTELKSEVNICRSSYSPTFVKASTYLSTVVARLYPYANPSSGSFIKRSIYAAVRRDRGGGRGGSFNDRGCGRGHGGRGGRGRGGHVDGGSVRGVSRCWKNMVSYSTRSRCSSIYYTRLCHKTQS